VAYALIIKPQAEYDIQDAYDWYELKNTGLGESLLSELEATFNIITRSPKSFQERYRKIRICFTNQFPFGVHYKIEHEKIIVLAVLHTSRSPENWKDY
jgi:plasmid stabilization system protein ParE